MKRKKRVRPFSVSGCTETLESMREVAGGHFCSRCEEKVWDVSRATEQEVAELFAREGKEICLMITANSNGEATFRKPPSKSAGLVLLSTLVASASSLGCGTQDPVSASVEVETQGARGESKAEVAVMTQVRQSGEIDSSGVVAGTSHVDEAGDDGSEEGSAGSGESRIVRGRRIVPRPQGGPEPTLEN